MVSLYIDNIPVSVKKNSTVLQACDSLGIDVPRFCFHERLLIAGNCRMCLVEIEKSPKPVASCALPVMEGMRVFTKTPLVKKAQEGVLEFLLLNHPLDCPICDQGGECDLQDQAMFFGSDSSRFYQPKRGVEDKNCGPLIKTIMTRCIHCTRCVRFSSEIAGVPELGTLGRGTNTQIGTYVEKTLSSELSGNMIDLCPVGALTSKPYAFKARSWELKNIKSIDTSDSCGSNIVVSCRGNEVMRILPRLNENINEEWISDKTRFCYDGLGVQRLSVPLFINQNNKKFDELDWAKGFDIFLSNISKYIYNLDKKINVIFGKDTDLETALVLKHFFNKLNCFSLYIDEVFKESFSDIYYKSGIKMKDISKHDLCVLVNVNTRFQTPMLNLHLRKSVKNGITKVMYFGPTMDLTFDALHLGLNNNNFYSFLEGNHIHSNQLKEAKNPLFIFNDNTFSGKDLIKINSLVPNFQWMSLGLGSNSTGLKDLGIKSISDIENNSNIINLYINVDLQNNLNKNLLNKNFSVYCGSHGFDNLNKIDLIFPGKAFTEKKVNFMNLEGLVQTTNKCVGGLGNSREEWKTFTAFFYFIKLSDLSFNNIIKINFEDFFSLNKFFSIEYPFLKKLNNYNKSLNLNFDSKLGLMFDTNKVYYKTRIVNFYKTNILSSLSKIMSDCSLNVRKYNFIK